MEKVKIKKNRKVKTRIEFHDEKVFHSSFFVVRNVEQFFFFAFSDFPFSEQFLLDWFIILIVGPEIRTNQKCAN